jgi:hypothetical protein
MLFYYPSIPQLAVPFLALPIFCIPGADVLITTEPTAVFSGFFFAI